MSLIACRFSFPLKSPGADDVRKTAESWMKKVYLYLPGTLFSASVYSEREWTSVCVFRDEDALLKHLAVMAQPEHTSKLAETFDLTNGHTRFFTPLKRDDVRKAAQAWKPVFPDGQSSTAILGRDNIEPAATWFVGIITFPLKKPGTGAEYMNKYQHLWDEGARNSPGIVMTVTSYDQNNVYCLTVARDQISFFEHEKAARADPNLQPAVQGMLEYLDTTNGGTEVISQPLSAELVEMLKFWNPKYYDPLAYDRYCAWGPRKPRESSFVAARLAWPLKTPGTGEEIRKRAEPWYKKVYEDLPGTLLHTQVYTETEWVAICVFRDEDAVLKQLAAIAQPEFASKFAEIFQLSDTSKGYTRMFTPIKRNDVLEAAKAWNLVFPDGYASTALWGRENIEPAATWFVGVLTFPLKKPGTGAEYVNKFQPMWDELARASPGIIMTVTSYDQSTAYCFTIAKDEISFLEHQKAIAGPKMETARQAMADYVDVVNGGTEVIAPPLSAALQEFLKFWKPKYYDPLSYDRYSAWGPRKV